MQRILKIIKTGSLYVLLVFLFMRCHSQEKFTQVDVYEFQKNDSIVINLPFPTLLSSLDVQHIIFGCTNYLYAASYNDKKLVQINLDKKEVERVIDLKFLANNNYLVFGFHVFSENNILIHRDVSNYRSVSDSAFVLVDTTGNIKQSIPVSGLNFVQGDNRNPFSVSLIHAFRPLFFFENKLFFSPRPFYNNVLNEHQIDSAKVPRLITFEHLENGKAAMYVSPFTNPQIKIGNYSYNQRNIFLEPISDTLVLVAYTNNTSFYLVNIYSGEVVTTSQNQNLLVSEPLPFPSDYKGDNNSNQLSSCFSSITYNQHTKQTVRFAYLAADREMSRGDYGEFLRNKWFGVYDSTLQLLGQGLKPKWFNDYWPKTIPTEKGWLTIYQNREDLTDFRVYYSALAPSTTPLVSLKKQISQIKDVALSKQLEDYPLLNRLPNQSIVLLMPKASCPYCINFITQYYITNIDLMEKKHIYLITNSDQAQTLLGSRKSPYIIREEKRVLENYLNESISNPMLFLWEDKTIKKSILLNPNESEQIGRLLNIMIAELKK